MGSYIPADKRPVPRRSVSRALLEAERDHMMDCPNAEVPLRLSAFFLDAILCTILWKGIDASCGALGTYLQGTLRGSVEGLDIRAIATFTAQMLRIAMLYLYYIWCEVRHGGTPAKLLLGLRVIDARSGHWLSLPRTLLRELLGKPLSVVTISIVPVLRADRRTLHDLMSDSVVKRIYWLPADGDNK